MSCAKKLGTLNSGNGCLQSFYRVLFSRLLFKNVKLKIFRAVVLSFVLFGLRNFVLVCSGWRIGCLGRYFAPRVNK